jgi:hypothetical protein
MGKYTRALTGTHARTHARTHALTSLSPLSPCPHKHTGTRARTHALIDSHAHVRITCERTRMRANA